MSLYLNRPKIFGNTANSGSKLLYSCIQQIYIVHIESGGTSVVILLLTETSFFPLRVQKAEVSATLELEGTEHISTTQWGWRGRVSQCHNGIKCSEFMLQDGEDCQMHRSDPRCTFSQQVPFCTRWNPQGNGTVPPFYICKLSTAAAPRSGEWSSYFELVK